MALLLRGQKMFGRDLSKLTPLRTHTPDKLMPVVREVWPDIKAALEKGHAQSGPLEAGGVRN